MKKILLIENDRGLQKALAAFTKLQKFTAIRAEDSIACLDIARSIRPDLIICDLDFPKINGYKILHTLRKDLETAKIPFIFISANDLPSYRDYAMQLGATDYLIKPISFPKLLKAIALQFPYLRKKLLSHPIAAANQIIPICGEDLDFIAKLPPASEMVMTGNCYLDAELPRIASYQSEELYQALSVLAQREYQSLFQNFVAIVGENAAIALSSFQELEHDNLAVSFAITEILSLNSQDFPDLEKAQKLSLLYWSRAGKPPSYIYFLKLTPHQLQQLAVYAAEEIYHLVLKKSPSRASTLLHTANLQSVRWQVPCHQFVDFLQLTAIQTEITINTRAGAAAPELMARFQRDRLLSWFNGQYCYQK